MIMMMLARQALKDGKVELMFGDGMGLMFWINGTQSGACCEFRGGAFSDQHYFGDGIGIAVRKGDHALRKQVNKALEVMRSVWPVGRVVFALFPDESLLVGIIYLYWLRRVPPRGR